METHNATTKEDMMNIIRFLVDCVDLNLREEFDYENSQIYPSKERYIHLLNVEVPKVKLGNKNKTGECGMCGVKVKELHYQKVGQVEFMICERCKDIMS